MGYEEGTGTCEVCRDDDLSLLKVDCGHWACEGCYYTVIEDGKPAGTYCDKCDPPERTGIERMETEGL